MAACAARRAAAMKFDLPAGSGMTGGRTFSSAASEAAMRSAGELPPRERPAPGSSGWSGGRFGSIGRRSDSGRRVRARRRRRLGGGRLAEHRGLRRRHRRARHACPEDGRPGSADGRRCHRHRRRRALLGRCWRARQRVADAGFDRRQPVDHVAERAVHALERILGALDVALERIGVRALDAGAPRRHALAFHLDQQVGEPALDRAEVVEARSRRRRASRPAA